MHTYENQQSQGVSSTFKGQSILFKKAGEYAYVDFNQAFSGNSGLTVSTWVKLKEPRSSTLHWYRLQLCRSILDK